MGKLGMERKRARQVDDERRQVEVERCNRLIGQAPCGPQQRAPLSNILRQAIQYVPQCPTIQQLRKSTFNSYLHHSLSIGSPPIVRPFFSAIPELFAKMMHPSRQAFVEDHPMDEVSHHQIAAFQWSLPFAQNITTARGSTDWCACT